MATPKGITNAETPMAIEIAIRVDHYFHAEQKPPKGVTLANIADAIAALSKGQDMKHTELVSALQAAKVTQGETNDVLRKVAGEVGTLLALVQALKDAAEQNADDVPEDVAAAAQALIDGVSESKSLSALVDAMNPDAGTGGSGGEGGEGGTGEGGTGGEGGAAGGTGEGSTTTAAARTPRG